MEGSVDASGVGVNPRKPGKVAGSPSGYDGADGGRHRFGQPLSSVSRFELIEPVQAVDLQALISLPSAS
jgi:hypothetical protein